MKVAAWGLRDHGRRHDQCLALVSALLLLAESPASHAQSAYAWLATNAWLSQRTFAVDVDKIWHATPLTDVKTAAREGRPEAQYELYFRLRGDAAEPLGAGRAGDWLIKSAEGGCAKAQVALGFVCAHPEEGISQHRTNWPTPFRVEAVHWYQLAAAQNHAPAQLLLALCYRDGTGIGPDEDLAVQWLRKAADQGHSDAQVWLADLYTQGIGAPRDDNDRPINLLLRSAGTGNQNAFYPLEYRLQNGLGTDQNLLAASEWYGRAAVFNVPGYSLNGKILPPEQHRHAAPFEAALSLYLRSAKPGEVDAPQQIAQMYLAGNRVPRHSGKAWMWLNLAAERGASAAMAARAEMEGKLKPEELTDAKARAKILDKNLSDIRPLIQ